MSALAYTLHLSSAHEGLSETGILIVLLPKAEMRDTHARFADNRPTDPQEACGEAQICAAPGPTWEGTLLPVGTQAESQLAAAQLGAPGQCHRRAPNLWPQG